MQIIITEAILSSIFPIYENTYLKLPKSQKDFWTIVQIGTIMQL